MEDPKRIFYRVSQREVLLSLLFLPLVYVLYFKTFGHSWTYDDAMVIVDNPDVRSWAAFTSDSYPGRPVREFSYLIDHFLFGMSPGAWQIQNLFWHGLNTVLLFLFLARVSSSRWLAGFTVFFYMIHPLQVEVVANASHRKDSLALAFCLLAIHCFLNTYNHKTPWPWVVGIVLCFTVAVNAKQNAVVLPAILLVAEWLLIPKAKWQLLRLPGLKFILPLGGVVIGVSWWFYKGGLSRFLEWSNHLLTKLENFDGLAGGAYFKMLFKSWSFMFSRVFWPQDLAVEYLFTVPTSWLDPWVVTGFAIPVLILACVLLTAKKAPLIAFGCMWFLIYSLPTSNLWPMVYPAADRYLYTPLIGAGLVSACVLGFIGSRAIKNTIGIIVGFVFVIVSWQQIDVWENDETLFLHSLQVSPSSSYIRNELGKYYAANSRFQEAATYYREAIKQNPGNMAVYYNLGQVYEASGLLEMAIKQYRIFTQNDEEAYRQATEELRRRMMSQYGVSL